MAQIIFNINNDRLQRVVDGLLEVYPNNETMDDPSWVDPKDGSVAPTVQRYSDNAWLKEVVRRFITSNVKRGEEVKAKRVAKGALQDTNTLVS